MSPERRQAPFAIASVIAPIVVALLIAALPLEPAPSDVGCPYCGTKNASAAATPKQPPPRLASQDADPRRP